MDVKGGGISGGSTKFDKGRGYLRPHTLTSSSIYRRGRSVFFIFFLLREVFGYGSPLCLRFSSPLVRWLPVLLGNYSGWWGCSCWDSSYMLRRRDKCSAYCLPWKLCLGPNLGKLGRGGDHFTRRNLHNSTREYNDTRLFPPNSPFVISSSSKQLLRKGYNDWIKIVNSRSEFETKENTDPLPSRQWPLFENTRRPRTVTWPSFDREKRRGRDLWFVVRYLSHGSCQRTVKVGWMFHAINSTDINRGGDGWGREMIRGG